MSYKFSNNVLTYMYIYDLLKTMASKKQLFTCPVCAYESASESWKGCEIEKKKKNGIIFLIMSHQLQSHFFFKDYIQGVAKLMFTI